MDQLHTMPQKRLAIHKLSKLHAANTLLASSNSAYGSAAEPILGSGNLIPT
jgi:hypothetical protein